MTEEFKAFERFSEEIGTTIRPFEETFANNVNIFLSKRSNPDPHPEQLHQIWTRRGEKVVSRYS